MSTPSPTFDARALTEPVDKAAARAYVKELKRSGRAPSTSPFAIIVIVLVGVFALFAFGAVATTTIAALWTGLASGRSNPGALVFSVLPGFVVVAVMIAAIIGLIRLFGVRQGERWWRLDRFARANAMTWYPSVPTPPLPGMVFGIGHGRQATDVVRGETPRFVEFGNYTYRTGSGKNQTTHRWGYVAVKLSTPLPNIVLDAVGNNSFFGSNLPAALNRSQRLSLEGDFDNHFRLYCPQGYEADALYLFTPDIMARFVDHAAALDAEIVDDWLFLYTQRQVSTLDPATWAWLFSVVGALLDKFAQWERWRDDRLAAASAAPAPTVPEAPAAGVPGVPGVPGAGGAGVGGAGVGGAGASVPAPSAGASLPFAVPPAALRPPGVAPEGRRLRRGVPWGAIVAVGIVFFVIFLMQSGIMASLLGGLFR